MQVNATNKGIELTDSNEDGLVEWRKLLTVEQVRKLLHDLQIGLFDHYNLKVKDR